LKVEKETSGRSRNCAEVNPHALKCSAVKLVCKPRTL